MTLFCFGKKTADYAKGVNLPASLELIAAFVDPRYTFFLFFLLHLLLFLLSSFSQRSICFGKLLRLCYVWATFEHQLFRSLRHSKISATFLSIFPSLSYQLNLSIHLFVWMNVIFSLFYFHLHLFWKSSTYTAATTIICFYCGIDNL